jgi:general stress protein 26
MTTDTNDRQAVEGRLWKEIDKAHYGMLGLVGTDPAQHFQPMTAFTDEASSAIYFFTRSDTDLARDSSTGGHQAMLVIQAKDRELQACLGGRLSAGRDQSLIDRYWNPVIASWFPEGKEDPNICVLTFRPDDAQVWISDQGPVRFAWEIAKANATGKAPDVGAKTHLNLN